MGRVSPIPLTTPIRCYSASWQKDSLLVGDDAASAENGSANEALVCQLKAHLAPHSPSVSPVREPTPEKQPVSERPPSPSPTIPETAWVVPNPVSPVTDWRPWPCVLVHSPIRDHTPKPGSLPTPPAESFIFEEPLVFGPEPRPAGRGGTGEEEVPLKGVAVLLIDVPGWNFSTPALSSFQANLFSGKAPMPNLEYKPAEFLVEECTSWKRLEEEQASERLVQWLRAEDLAQDDLPNVSEKRAKELDDLMMRMTKTDWLNLMLQVGSNLALARELLGADVNERNLSRRMTTVKERKKHLGNLPHNGTITRKNVPAATTLPADDPDSAGGGSSNPAGSATPMAGSAASNTAVVHCRSLLTLCHTTAAMDSAGGRSDPHRPNMVFKSLADPDSDDEVLAEIIFLGKSISGDGVVFVDKLPDDEIVDPRVKVETVSESASSPPRSRRKHLRENRRRRYFTYLKQLLPYVYREDLLLLRRRMNRYFRLNPDVDVGLELWRDVNMFVLTMANSPRKESVLPIETLCVSLKSVDVAKKLLFFDVATSFASAVHRVHDVSFDAAVLDVASPVSAA
ncbi:hypothetical protein Tco_0968278 [Tanacetum coccineum]